MDSIVLLGMLGLACLCVLGAFVDNEEEDNDTDN